MKKHGILNSDISKVLADLGHTDQITIGDCGLPVPSDVKKIDVSLSQGFPKFIEVLKVVLEDMKIEKVILAEEIKQNNATQLEAIELLLEDEIEIEFVSHEEFKQQTQQSKAVIRTGEITPYSNIILQSNVTF
ncbi:D-ribose pyranase [Globicatella sanguinis]|uniref:D-ribose pyranase n=1 Tax=Globicatella sanguinis TaxID=13076 RepID=UPI00082598E4|nr:D-ribose pyranase [Globicatella sanguinis]MDK7630936.1 D-ribose pyranase [Globicatella sanguinis]WIK67416.1 D-ribose pyranase [Globicatella sanguinis]WKT56821.1 D-ribose pyranase [Globicatella sanguinis]